MEKVIGRTKEKLEQIDSLQKVKDIADGTKDGTEIDKKLKQIESLQKVVEEIDRQLTPGQGAAQEQAGAAKPSAVSTWQKMNVLLNPAVPPPPARGDRLRCTCYTP